MKTTGECRYRQAIPKGSGGLLDIDSNYGFRKQFLPQVIKMESFVEIDTFFTVQKTNPSYIIKYNSLFGTNVQKYSNLLKLSYFIF